MRSSRGDSGGQHPTSEVVANGMVKTAIADAIIDSTHAATRWKCRHHRGHAPNLHLGPGIVSLFVADGNLEPPQSGHGAPAGPVLGWIIPTLWTSRTYRRRPLGSEEHKAGGNADAGKAHKAGGKRWFITNQAETGKSDGGQATHGCAHTEQRLGG